jgi:hypothetical protein
MGSSATIAAQRGLWPKPQAFTSAAAAIRPADGNQHVPQRPSHIFEEMLAAARGIAAVAVGDRRAASFFDFSPRGLAGSFIAFLVATAFSAYLPNLTGGPSAGIPTSRLVLMAGLLFAVQLGFSALVLRQLKRLDGFVPYLVADNWATFYVTVVSSLLTLFGLSSDAAVLLIGILVLVIEINIGRLVVGLNGWQIAMLLVAQLVGVGLGLLLVGLVVPLPADVVAAG